MLAFMATTITYSWNQFKALATGVNVINNSQLLLTDAALKAAAASAFNFSIKHVIFLLAWLAIAKAFTFKLLIVLC